MPRFTLDEADRAAEIMAMRLVLLAFLDAQDGPQLLELLHTPRPLYQRAGLADDAGARLVGTWTRRGWWVPVPTFATGGPTEAGILAMSRLVDELEPQANRDWFAGLEDPQVLELLGGGLPDGWDAAGMCPACGFVFATVMGTDGLPALVRVRCPHCEAPIKAKDWTPRPLPVAQAQA